MKIIIKREFENGFVIMSTSYAYTGNCQDIDPFLQQYLSKTVLPISSFFVCQKVAGLKFSDFCVHTSSQEPFVCLFYVRCFTGRKVGVNMKFEN